MQRALGVGIMMTFACTQRASPEPAGAAAKQPPTVPAPAVPAALEDLSTTIDQRLAARPPTFVVGTLGDAAADRSVGAQAAMIAALLPGARIVPDTSIDVGAGPAAWPPNPVLYGNADVNAVVRALGAALPFAIDRAQLAIGGATFTAPGDRILASIPARALAPAHPGFVLLAGTGMPGTVDINSVRHGGDAILIADAFGRLQTGRWDRADDGTLEARLDPPARRIAWRLLERIVAGGSVRIAFPRQVPAAADDDAIADAVARGVTTAAARLGIAAFEPVTVYVAPDRRSKASLTGDPGDGHAVAIAHALHVVRGDPAPGGGWEHMLVHESTHVLAGTAWGAVATPLLGEGLAVWASGTYGGVPLATLAREPGDRPAPSTLLAPRTFRALPERDGYLVAGLLVGAAVDAVGLPAVREHLWPATAATWEAACQAAGTTAAALDAAVAAVR